MVLAFLYFIRFVIIMDSKSLWEVLLTAIPYGLEYQSETNAYVYLDELLAAYSHGTLANESSLDAA